jgi:hypothetical protein
MRFIHRRLLALAVAAAFVAAASGPARAWDPPAGPFPDQATPPATPTTLVRNAHGYIIQNGISILYNDGYWFAAQALRQQQQELLNGVKYADEYQGRQAVNLEVCGIGFLCTPLDDFKDWPLAADNHYFNPDTGLGLNPGYLHDAATWGPYLTGLISNIVSGISLGIVNVDIVVQPELASQYPSSVSWFAAEYSNAVSAFTGGAAASINGRQGTALGVFYLGWASHFMQDATVAHHTFDQVLKNHSNYEAAADGYITTAPAPTGQKTGIYADQLPALACSPGSRTCFPTYAAYTMHDPNIVALADQGIYVIDNALSLAQRLQAGLYAAFLTDAGKRPVHMSAVMAVLRQL